MFLELDSLTVLNIVDNETDGLSTPCSCCSDASQSTYYKSELSSHIPKNGGTLDFNAMCSAGHGLSLLLIAECSGQSHVLLFDAGPTPSLFEHNSTVLGVNMSTIETIVLSHYHPDHSGGLRSAVPLIAEARATCNLSPVVVDLHPNLVENRGVKFHSEGNVIQMVPGNPSFDELQEMGAKISTSDGVTGHTILDDMFYVSGEIPRTTSYETGFPGHCSQQEDGSWVDDPLIMEERYVAVQLKGGGVVVFSACSHAGIVNVCKDVMNNAGDGTYLMGVVGGFHLAGRGCEERIEETVADLKQLNPSVVIAGHCTGWRAKVALARAFSGRFQPALVGGQYTFKPVEKETR